MMRALIVADSRLVAEIIQRSLHGDAAIDVVCCVDGATPCDREFVAARPDVVVFDEMVEPRVALARIAEARAAAPGAKLVVLAARMQDAWLADAVRAGADAAVCKSTQPRGIATLIRAIASGAVYHRFTHPSAPDHEPAPANGGLTPREHEILQQVAEGGSNGEIAARLCVTEQTVKFHLSNVYRKLGVANRTQASRYAHVHRLVGSSSAPASPRTMPRAA
jgi:DNA-binding NarL/FixJ family response regulator